MSFLKICSYRAYFSNGRKGNGLCASTDESVWHFESKEYRCEVHLLLYFTEYTIFSLVIDAEVAYPYL